MDEFTFINQKIQELAPQVIAFIAKKVTEENLSPTDTLLLTFCLVERLYESFKQALRVHGIDIDSIDRASNLN